MRRRQRKRRLCSPERDGWIFRLQWEKRPWGLRGLPRSMAVIAFAGSVTKEAAACNDNGIDAFFPIVRGVCTLEEAMQREKAMENLTDSVEQVFRLL